MARRKLHGAALAAHRARLARGGYKHPKHKAKRHRSTSMATNPRPRRTHARPHRNPRARRRRYRNPMGMGNVGRLFMDSLMGAAGGAVVDLALKPLPVTWKTGPMSYAVRGAAAILLGIAGAAVKIPRAQSLAEGALTITLYSALRDYVTVPMGLGELTQQDAHQLAMYYSPAPGQTLQGTYVPADAAPGGMGYAHYDMGTADIAG